MTETLKKLAVWKFSSCDGCQLSVLDLEDDLLLLADAINIAYFPEATSIYQEGPYDLSLVEGSITTLEDEKRIQKVRSDSKVLITIGACATAGGIQALRNFGNVKEFAAMVYAHPQYIKTLETSSAISDHVDVDFELRGCPINKHQLLDVVTSYLMNKTPNVPNESVCMDCKRNATVCVIVAKQQACLGPVTHAGCGALCPKYGRGCYGCFGPKESTNTASLTARLTELGATREELLRLYRNFNAASPEFEEESRKHD
jgi:sulfhydrogenase subunit delta